MLPQSNERPRPMALVDHGVTRRDRTPDPRPEAHSLRRRSKATTRSPPGDLGSAKLPALGFTIVEARQNPPRSMPRRRRRGRLFHPPRICRVRSMWLILDCEISHSSARTTC